MPLTVTIDAVLILRRLQEYDHGKGKMQDMYFVDPEYRGKCLNGQCVRKKYQKF